MTLKRYTKRVGALALTVEPLNVSGHGEYPNSWVARVDLTDVMVDGWPVGNVNVARKHYGRRDPAAARAVAINRGHAMLINALIAGIGQTVVIDDDDETEARIAAHERALMTESYDHMFGE